MLIGTHEVGGLTPIQVLEIIRGCRGLSIIGGDVAEVIKFYVCCVHACFVIICM